ncbi:hypothetical protein FisN_1Lh611 [Fistulifera solaris]|uniref:Uncharacterized protein n=1 Tax=Fistulifera solaris TaxID=1519565 RepID=A0A1Z5K0V3_FISSO|nr:hypothetical protein FisN_1Lh611 [Fistulifera solaris]|eukprot:GAX19920.1 hypothetical protein FisN_1Lh611 [Fistulifera solaris]
MTSTEHSSHLFARIGGPNAVRDIVDELDKVVSNDPELMRLFDGVRLSLIKVHHHMILRMAFEGVTVEAERSILLNHKRLFVEKGLNGDHFDALCCHLVDALERCSVAHELVEEAAENISKLRDLFEDGETSCQFIQTEEEIRQEQNLEIKSPLRSPRKNRNVSVRGALRHIFSPSAHAA